MYIKDRREAFCHMNCGLWTMVTNPRPHAHHSHVNLSSSRYSLMTSCWRRTVVQGECNLSLEQLVRARAVLHKRVAIWTVCATIWIYAAGRRCHDAMSPQEDCWLWCYTTCLRTIGQGSQKSECEVAHRILPSWQ